LKIFLKVAPSELVEGWVKEKIYLCRFYSKIEKTYGKINDLLTTHSHYNSMGTLIKF
jgi:hypothetical protein